MEKRIFSLVVVYLICSWFTSCSPKKADLASPSKAIDVPRQDNQTALPKPAAQKTPRTILQNLIQEERFASCQPDRRTALFELSTAQLGKKIIPGPNSLRTQAEKRNVFIGAAVAPGFITDPFYSSLLADEFNMITPDNVMKWEFIHPEQNRYDFTQGDLIVNFARQQGMLVRGHVLVWDLQLPKWITEANHSRSVWIQILCRHIKTVVTHYRGQIYAWDVVNEAINGDGSLRNTFWMRVIGPEHIAMAFQWAHEADPDALLFYNDNGGEGLNSQSQAIYMLVRSLIEARIPIDGVGMQMHTALNLAPSAEDLRANMERLSELGLEIQITEMDVKLQYSDESESVELVAQAEIYRQTMDVCLQVINCSALVTWGLTDRFSWIPGWTGVPDAPLLFDDEAQPKPAYYALLEALSEQ